MNNFNSHYWIKHFGIEEDIMDSDGWDRTNYENSMNEEISKEEFITRCGKSTVRFSDNMRKMFNLK